jgi:hypothetical protein
VYGDDDAACRKCAYDKKGCKWNGRLRTGAIEKKPRVAKAKRVPSSDVEMESPMESAAPRARQSGRSSRKAPIVYIDASPKGEQFLLLCFDIMATHWFFFYTGSVVELPAVAGSSRRTAPKPTKSRKGKEVETVDGDDEAAMRADEIRRLRSRASFLIRIADHMETQ